MIPALWPHRSNRQCIEVVLLRSKPSLIRRLVAGDAKISGGGTIDSPVIVSMIASITIGKNVFGTPETAITKDDHFGFEAQQIGSFHCLGFTAALSAGTDAALELALTTGDVTIREVV
jgi:hypothetical protein